MLLDDSHDHTLSIHEAEPSASKYLGSLSARCTFGNQLNDHKRRNRTDKSEWRRKFHLEVDILSKAEYYASLIQGFSTVSMAHAMERSRARNDCVQERSKVSILFRNAGYEKGSFEIKLQVKSNTKWVWNRVLCIFRLYEGTCGKHTIANERRLKLLLFETNAFLGVCYSQNWSTPPDVTFVTGKQHFSYSLLWPLWRVLRRHLFL